ncbi:MAG: aminotransferase class I/II-fold pyridoxal phosphate-dependent enzyme [Gemmatimonadota bacterium]|nr:MAG: aminotransferase class I/II-fold pyridoxal phosphate-dependent enzyme [Gemmatimonadota bacterium]
MALEKTLSRRNFLRSSASAMGLVYLSVVEPEMYDHTPGVHAVDYPGRLCYNENPLGPSPQARAAMSKAVAMAHRYPDWFCSNLESRIAAHHGLQQNNICVGAGATEVIRLIADAFLGPGDEMITATPTYSQMGYDATSNGASVVEIPVDENYDIDLQGIFEAIGSNTRMISLVNPNNPLARVINKTDMEAFIREVPTGIVVVVDEAYHHYVHSPDYESCIRFVDEGLPVVVVRTFSKAFGLAGARIGYAVASSEYTPLIASTQLFGTVSNLGQAAAEAALNDMNHVNNTVAINDEVKGFLETEFTHLGLDFIPSETNFMMIDVGTDAETVVSQLASRGFLVRSGWGMRHHIRVSTGLMHEAVSFVGALKDVLDLGFHYGLKGSGESPKTFGLNSVYPNPFNSQCKIKITAHRDENVSLTIYDTLGRKVRSLVHHPLRAGVHYIPWDGKNAHGNSVASGVYIISLIQGECAESSRVTLIR